MKRLPSASTIGGPVISRATSATFGRPANSSDGSRSSTRRLEFAVSENGSLPIWRSSHQPVLGASRRPSRPPPQLEHAARRGSARGTEDFCDRGCSAPLFNLGTLAPEADAEG